MAKTFERKDVQQEVTDRLIAMMETCDSNWQRPWLVVGSAGCIPVNIVSGKEYQGGNIIILWATAMVEGYTSNIWGTFKQWQGKGHSVPKGAKGTMCVKWNTIAKKDKGQVVLDKNGNPEMIPVPNAFYLFNADQVGYKPDADVPVVPVAERVEHIETYLANLNIAYQENGNGASYNPVLDRILMPTLAQFKDTPTSTATEAYYGTKCHEYVHGTGHKTRCDRKLANRFGDEFYAFEELIAEIGSAILCARFGISATVREDHAKYMKSWVKRMKEDKKAIFNAASDASKAIAWMDSQQPKVEIVTAEEEEGE